MQRAVAHYLPGEMAVLGLVEFSLSFAVIYAVIEGDSARAALPGMIEMLPRGDIAFAGLLTLTIGGIALTIGLYHPEVCRDRKRLLSATALTAIVTFTLLMWAGGRERRSFADSHTLHMVEILAAWLATIALIRLVHFFAVSRIGLTRRVLLLGDPGEVGILAARMRSGRGCLFRQVTLHDQPLSWQSLRQQAIWRVVIASIPEAATMESLLECKLRGTRILSGTSFHENYLGRIDLDALTPNDLLLSHGFAVNRVSAALKRLCDIVLGSCMLMLMLPLMTIIAIAIRLDSSGPTLYRQLRVGHFGATFTLFKFRSMTSDAERCGSPLWAQQRDPRITRIGRFIRATRIDELPQLANVIRGEMSLVGPRPERPHFVEQLARAIPFYRQRTYVKPGLTGWAQVNFPYGASIEDAREKLAYDLYYVKNRSMMLDLIILISTIRVVLFREGAR